MKKTIPILILLFTIISLLTGCSVDGEGGDDNPTKYSISSIDISGAKAVMISPNTTSINNMLSVARSSSADNIFVKIKSDGTFEKVSVLDKNGNQLDNVFPSNIYDCNDTYIIFVINEYPYLTNKITGSTYDLSVVGVPEMLRANGGYDGEIRKSIYTDSDNNIYYLYNGIVKKIDITNPNAVTAMNYTPDVYYISSVDDFAVDNSGNIIFTYQNNFIRYTKIKKTNNSLTSLAQPSYLSYTGYDGIIYYQPATTSMSSASGIIQKVDIDSGSNITYSNYGNITVPGQTGGQGYRWLYFEDRIIITQSTRKTEIYKTGGFPSTKTLSFLSSDTLKILKCSTDYYYVATKQGAILKIDPANNDSYTTLINNDEYDYYKMTVTNDDTVLFYALRLSDSKKVIGKISSAGTVSIIDDTLTDEVILLEKLN